MPPSNEEKDKVTRGVQDDAATGPTGVAASVRSLSKSFKGARVLEDVSFDVAEGEALVLLGASGSGKTTILRIIAGLEQPDTGSVILHGQDVTELPARERGVGVIFQSYALFPRMSVEKNIGYGLRIRKRPRKEIKETVERLLKLVRLEEHRGKRPAQLSGGQQQRVAIARTLAYNPQVLLFDEPFGALDAQTRVRLRREIRGLLREVNVPAVFITHDQEEALELGDRIAVLHAGRLEQVGTPDEVYNKPETEYVATFLGAANLLVGVYAGGHVHIAGAHIPAAEEAARFREGQSVKLVFRPEDAHVSPRGTLPEGARRLANGLVEEKHFVGAYERLTVRLDVQQDGDTAPRETTAAAIVAAVAANTNATAQTSARTSAAADGDADDVRPAGTPVIVTRPKHEASTTPINPGDRVAVGLNSFRVLPNYALASERAGTVVDAGRK